MITFKCILISQEHLIFRLMQLKYIFKTIDEAVHSNKTMALKLIQN